MLQQGQFNKVGVAVFLTCLAIGLGVAKLNNSPVGAAVDLLTGTYFLFAIRIVDQWQKVALLRLGRYRGLRGPGLFLIIPLVETLSRFVDQRVRVTTVSAESTLTRDTVPVNVDAIIFWLVWNAEKSILEVEDFVQAITLSSQTALRESIGRHQLGQMITELLVTSYRRSSTRRQTLGESRCSQLKSETCAFPRHWKTRCRNKLRQSANGRPA